METRALFEQLAAAEQEGWNEIYEGDFIRHLRTHGIDRDLYVALMTEIYHYTRHNAQNQALAVLGVQSDRLALLKYCLHHAYQEAGHDQMVIRDLAQVGVQRETVESSNPLPETQAFVAYLYQLAHNRDATHRLGYSYWAENAYAYISELIEAIKRDVKLTDDQLTFFVEHSTIDEAHFAQVKNIIANSCVTEEQQAGALDALKVTLRLTGNIMDAVYREVQKRRSRTAAA
ncbi:MAG: iron-containing redox enzyme family protein [Proteobacteria bacterium]|nr:iron-containing redox enzyme family protein [Pseudomonadota bacterium]